jgi:hypothetical protein
MRSVLKLLAHAVNWARVHDHLLLMPFEKRDRLARIIENLHIGTVVETGTYLGETAAYLATRVRRVISIEIDEKNAAEARRRCAAHANVEILLGSSEKLLPDVLSQLSGPVLFWLDAHYQTGMTKGRRRCPLFDELAAILDAKQIEPTIVIDDARKFIWVNGWPSLASVKNYVLKKDPSLSFRISGDMICIGRFSM